MNVAPEVQLSVRMFKFQFPVFYKSDFLEGKSKKSVALSRALGLQPLTKSGFFAEYFSCF